MDESAAKLDHPTTVLIAEDEELVRNLLARTLWARVIVPSRREMAVWPSSWRAPPALTCTW